MNVLQFIVIAALILLILYFLPRVQPLVWMEKGNIYSRKYVRKEKITADAIDEISMFSVPADGKRSISLKLKLTDGKEVEISGLINEPHFQTHTGMSLNALTLNYTTNCLPLPETIRRIIGQNTHIKLDEFVKAYTETNTIDKYLKVLNG